MMQNLSDYFGLILPFMGFGIVLGSFFPLLGMVINFLFGLINK